MLIPHPLNLRQNTMPYTLGYWKIRGLASPVRMAFAYTGTELKEDIYSRKSDGNGNYLSKWPVVYEEHAKVHPFPNLPYLVTPTGGIIVQSNAIIRHVGRVLGLFGDSTNEMEVTRVDEILEQVNDFRVEASSNYYAKEISPEFISGTIPYYLDILNKHLSTALEGKQAVGGPFFLGAKPTIVDFMAYEFLRTALPLVADKRAEYEAAHPKIFALLAAVEALPQLEAYLKSEQHLAYGANGPMANHQPGVLDYEE